MKLNFLNKNLRLLWAGQFISLIGDSALWAVLIYTVLALNPEGAEFKSGLVSFLETFPFLLFGVTAGMIGDRFDRKKVLIVADMARLIILMIVPLAFFFDFLCWQVLGIVAFGIGFFSAIFQPARDAFVPDLAQGQNLMKVNALFHSSTEFAIIGGTAIAAGILGASKLAVGAGDIPRLVLIFTLDGLTFLGSALFIVMIRPPADKRGSATERVTIRQHLAKAFDLAASSSLIRGLMFVTAIDNLFIMGPAIIGANLLVKNTFGKGPEGIALLHLVFSVGMLISSLVLLKLSPKLPKGKTVLLGIFLDGLTYLPYFFIQTYHQLLILTFIHSLTIPLIIIPRTTLIQENIPRDKIALAFSLINIMLFGFWSLSGLLTGYAAELLTEFHGPKDAPKFVFLAAGIGGSMTGLLGISFKGLRRAR